MKKIRRWRSGAAVVAGFVAVALGGFRNKAWGDDIAPPVSTGTPSALEERVNQLDRQLKALQDQVQAHELRLQPPGQPTAQQNEPAGEATAGRSGFALRSDDRNFLIRFQGLIQADGRFYTGSGGNTRNYTPAVAASAQGPAVSQFLLRRVRPILSGTLFRHFDFLFQPDFGGNAAAIFDAYLDIRPASYANLRIGKFKEPIGLERLQVDSYTTFPERGLTADLIPQRDTGLELYGGFWGNALTYQAALTNGTADGASTPDSDTNNAKSGTLRFFAQPFKNTSVVSLQKLGIGMAGSYTGDNTAVPTFKTAAGQEQFFSYASGISFNGEQSRLNPEAEYYRGPFGFFGEYTQTKQAAQAGGIKTRLTNEAWQVVASWLLTGEEATYTAVQPIKNFDRQAGTWGALQLVARWQQLQIDPDTFPSGFSSLATSASRATAYTAGINWYLNKFIKFAADYEQTWFNGGNGAGDRPIERVFDTRWQVAF